MRLCRRLLGGCDFLFADVRCRRDPGSARPATDRGRAAGLQLDGLLHWRSGRLWHREKRFEDPAEYPDFESTKVAIKGGLVGGYVGCQKQYPNNFVFGVEGSGFWTNIHGSKDVQTDLAPALVEIPPSTLSAHMDWLASMTVRLGLAQNTHLWYVRIGAAFAHERDSLTTPSYCRIELQICELASPVPETFTSSGDAIHAGINLGAGVDWALHSALSLRLEYNFYGFRKERVTLFEDGSTFGRGIDVTPTLHTSTVGLSYHF